MCYLRTELPPYSRELVWPSVLVALLSTPALAFSQAFLLECAEAAARAASEGAVVEGIGVSDWAAVIGEIFPSGDRNQVRGCRWVPFGGASYAGIL